MPASEPAIETFSGLDWIILAGYLVLVVLLAMRFARRQTSSDEFFLASRSMPMWAVAISVLATSLSAATFLGAPEQAFAGNLTYVLANLGTLIAAILVATIFIPRFYRARVTSVYELLGHEFGLPARQAACATFLIGRVFASGARLFIVAIPFAWIAFDAHPTPLQQVSVILGIAAVATVYTAVGGIRAVIWTDVLQAVLVISTVSVAAWILLDRIPATPQQIFEALSAETDADGVSKLAWLDLSTDRTRPYTLWAVLGGVMLINLAAYGTDQDLTQRMLTCKSARAGSASVILASLASIPVVLLFLCLGLLLHVYYARPDIMGDAAPAYAVDRTREVFVEYMLREMPSGLRGLMMAGLFAAAMSSLDSALNAMASTSVADFYRPWRLRREGHTLMGKRIELNMSRTMVIFWGAMLGGFACLCVFWQDASDMPLVDFALMVMAFAYSGMLAVFLTAILTPRGNAMSVIAALVTGFATVAFLQPVVRERLLPELDSDMLDMAFPWQMVIATTLSFVVCCLGSRRHVASQAG